MTVIREWKEEVNLDIKIIPAYRSAFSGDYNATPIPMPFHIDLEREGFDVPHIGFFFYVRSLSNIYSLKILKSELNNFGWFSKDQLMNLDTFDQVRALSLYVLNSYPKI